MTGWCTVSPGAAPRSDTRSPSLALSSPNPPRVGWVRTTRPRRCSVVRHRWQERRLTVRKSTCCSCSASMTRCVRRARRTGAWRTGHVMGATPRAAAGVDETSAADPASEPVAPLPAADAGPILGSWPSALGRRSSVGVGTGAWVAPGRRQWRLGRRALEAPCRRAGPCSSMVRRTGRAENPGFRRRGDRRQGKLGRGDGTGSGPSAATTEQPVNPGIVPWVLRILRRLGLRTGSRERPTGGRKTAAVSGDRGDGWSGAPAVVEGVVPTARLAGAVVGPEAGRQS